MKKWIVLSAIILLTLCGCENSKAVKEKQELEKKYTELEVSHHQLQDTYDILQNDYNGLLKKYTALQNPDNSSPDDQECQIVDNFRVLEILTDYQETTNTKKFIIVDRFQEHRPLVVAVPNSLVSKLKVGKSYNFIISGKKTDLLSSQYLQQSYQIKDIVEAPFPDWEPNINNTCRE